MWLSVVDYCRYDREISLAYFESVYNFYQGHTDLELFNYFSEVDHHFSGVSLIAYLLKL